MEGWVKIHRKILDNPISCKDSDYLAVWIYLLLNATHKEYDALFKGKRITLQKGQLITGTISISKKMNINKDKVQRILKSFENDKQITQQTSNKNRLISIINWNEYQDIDKQNDKQVINKCETTDKQLITNKNVKNIKNDKNVVVVSDSCVDDLQEIIDFYNNNIGIITPYATELFDSYLKDMTKDLIVLAMKKSVEADKRNINYIKAILNNWNNKRITTVEQAEEENKKHKKNNSTTDKLLKDQRKYEDIDFDSLYAN